MVIAVCLFSLFGCLNKKNHILDGPGMINPDAWNQFSVSRSDSYAQHNFGLTLEYGNRGLMVKGELRGEDGSLYEDEEGIVLSKADAKKIEDLRPFDLPDVVSTEPEDGGEEPELLVLDAPTISITVDFVDGRIVEKADADDFSLQVYQIVRPYFEKKHKS